MPLHDMSADFAVMSHKVEMSNRQALMFRVSEAAYLEAPAPWVPKYIIYYTEYGAPWVPKYIIYYTEYEAPWVPKYIIYLEPPMTSVTMC